MTRDKKSTDNPDVELAQGRPGRGARPMPADLQAHIGVRLKAFYDSVLSEPIPDRFAELLSKLDDAEQPRPAPARMDGASADMAGPKDETETDMRS